LHFAGIMVTFITPVGRATNKQTDRENKMIEYQ